MLSACIITPPIEPEPPDINQPPYIEPDRVRPQESIIAITDGNEIELQVTELFDPNLEESLHYALVGEKNGLVRIGLSGLSLDQDELYRGVFYRYEGVSYLLNPCSIALRGESTETIFLYVSDRPIEINDSDITIAEGAFLDVWAWVFQLQAGICE